jgi:hypothetical protein
VFRNIIRAEKQGASALLLHQEKGQPTKLVRRLGMFWFASSSIHLKNRINYSSKARTFEGRDLGGLVETAEYLSTEGSNPFFDVLSVDASVVISCEATCRDRFYGFKNETFVEFKKIRIDIHSSSPSRALLHPISDSEDDYHLLHIEVCLEKDQFDSLFRHLWISPTPATIRVAVSVPCFQYSTAGLAPELSQEAVLDSRLVVARLDDISVEKHLVGSPTDLDDPSEASSTQALPTQALPAFGDIKGHAAQIAQSIKRIELIVGIAAGVLIASTLL